MSLRLFQKRMKRMIKQDSVMITKNPTDLFRETVTSAIDVRHKKADELLLNEAPEIQKTLIDMNVRKNAIAEYQQKETGIPPEYFDLEDHMVCYVLDGRDYNKPNDASNFQQVKRNLHL